jgi:TolA-binding protein
MRLPYVPLALGSMLLAGLAFAATQPGAAPAAQPGATQRAVMPGAARPTDSPARPMTNPNASRIQDLDQQIKAKREQFHSQLDPLQAQIKALRDQFEPQIKTLEDQRHDLIESTKSPMVQDLDKREAGDLVALADQEKSEVEHVHQHYADLRKDTQAKYAKLRGEMK